MIYELAKSEDLENVYDVVQRTIKTIYPKYYPAEVVDFFCKHHNKEVISKDIEKGCVGVLRIKDKIIATGCFVENHITRVYVLPEYQKKGFGTFMIKNIEAQMSEKYDKAYLDASLPAAALYEKLDYKTVKHERYTVENGVILTYEVMEKELHKWKMEKYNFPDNEKGQVKMIYPETVLQYKRAVLEDMDELVRTRIIVLRAANKLSEEVDLSAVEKESYDYFKRALKSGEHIAYLVYDGETFIGAGGVSFYQVMPTVHNPSGKKAYIMNMYTAPEYRRQGIASYTLDLLVKAAKEKGISSIALEATDMGRPLYQKYGFVKMEDEMELGIQKRKTCYKDADWQDKVQEK